MKGKGWLISGLIVGFIFVFIFVYRAHGIFPQDDAYVIMHQKTLALKTENRFSIRDHAFYVIAVKSTVHREQ